MTGIWNKKKDMDKSREYTGIKKGLKVSSGSKKKEVKIPSPGIEPGAQT